MNDIATIFSIRRNVETGKLELDCYQQFDYAKLQAESVKAHAIAALEGREMRPADDPMNAAQIAAGGIKIRTTFDQAIIGTFGIRGDDVLDRHQFWEKHKKWTVAKFKEFKI
jgi:hypothetical protein